jgi:16S rRNA (guanine(966)-N(2))-methyltransferase RsmD
MIRIIAGKLKGRKIRVPQGRSVRPTAERVREALFSILGDRVSGARVLDAYSGSGALGFEALSRGAERVVFLEADRSVARLVEENAATLGISARCTIHPTEAAAWLSSGREERPFDLILADPPYGAEGVTRFLTQASSPLWLASEGWIVLERGAGLDAREEAGHGVVRFRTAGYGTTCLDFYAAAGG